MKQTYVKSTKRGGGNLPLKVDGIAVSDHRDAVEAMEAAGPYLIRGAKDVRWAGMVEYVFTLAEMEVDEPVPVKDPEILNFAVAPTRVGLPGSAVVAVDHGGRTAAWTASILHGSFLIGTGFGSGDIASFQTTEFQDAESLSIEIVVQYETGERFVLSGLTIEVQ